MATVAAPSVFTITVDGSLLKTLSEVVVDSRYCLTPAVTFDAFIASSQLQSAYLECLKLGHGSEETSQFIIAADSECTRLGKLTLPIPEILRTSITKFSDGILPSEQGGYAHYGELQENNDDGDGGTRTVSVPSLAAQRAKLVSTHIRFNDSDKHGSFADTNMTDKDQADPSASLGSQPESTGNLLLDFIINSKVDPLKAIQMDQLVAKLPHTKLQPAEWELLSDFVGRNTASVKQALDLMAYARKQETPVPLPMLDMVSHLRSTARAAQPPPFHGTLKDHGQPARLWVFSFCSYMQACNESKPILFVTSYLRDDALAWWQSFGMQKLSAAATLDQFQHIFLEKYVKPSDSIEARAELQKLTQAKQQSVEAYAAAFIQTRSRISLGTSVDSSTQARWFLNGLKSNYYNVKTVLTTTATVTVLNDIEQLMTAAIEAETKLSLTVTQDHQAGSGQAAAIRNGGRGGRGGSRHQPYGRGRGKGRGSGRGRGRFNGPAYQPDHNGIGGIGHNNSGPQPKMVTGVANVPNRTQYCVTCNVPGHLPGANCPRTSTNRRQVLTPDTLFTCAVQSAALPSSVPARARIMCGCGFGARRITD